jgi:predicted nucleic acid-binding protein
VTRFVIDAGVLVHLLREGIEVSPHHELLAPTLVRSQALSLLHESVHRGELSDDAALDLVERIHRIKVRLLGDAVLRRNAWRIADQLGWAETSTAEYLALTKLQADAFVTLDADLERSVRGVVPTAGVDDIAR